jgi:hypothetical protein
MMCACTVSLLLSPLQFIQAANSVKIFPPDSKPYGLSYTEHIKNFWKWLASIPVNASPMKDATGEKCSTGQSASNSSIFYLSGGGGGTWERVCKIPSGKGVLIPVMTVVSTTNELEEGQGTPARLDKIAKDDQDSVNSLYVKINDDEYSFANLSKYRTHTDLFEVVYPQDAIFSARPGVSNAIADGYYIITEPLTNGSYTVQYKGSLGCSPDQEGCLPDTVTFAHDIKYKLIVE